MKNEHDAVRDIVLALDKIKSKLLTLEQANFQATLQQYQIPVAIRFKLNDFVTQVRWPSDSIRESLRTIIQDEAEIKAILGD